MSFVRASLIAAAAALALSACNRGDGGEAAAEAAAFMERNARAEGVRVLPSGVQYKIERSGPTDGVQPDDNDLVRVHYEGGLVDGTIFDSSYERGAPAVFEAGQVIEGWTDVLQQMRVGDEWIVYIPPELGYGEDGAPPDIPGNAVLVFKIALLGVAETPGGSRNGGGTSALA